MEIKFHIFAGWWYNCPDRSTKIMLRVVSQGRSWSAGWSTCLASVRPWVPPQHAIGKNKNKKRSFPEEHAGAMFSEGQRDDRGRHNQQVSTSLEAVHHHRVEGWDGRGWEVGEDWCYQFFSFSTVEEKAVSPIYFLPNSRVWTLHACH